MVNVVVTGVAGRMGGTILRMLRDTDGLRLVGAVERPGWSGPGDAGEAAGFGPIGVPVGNDLAAVLARTQTDVVIDFTSHEASVRNATVAADAGVAIVIGSTGFPADGKARIQQDAARIPVVLSPNMSVGVNVTFKLLELAARALGTGYDVEIIEAHHRHKVDAPSGTAIKMGQVIAHAQGRDLADCAVYARQGTTGERDPSSIGFATIRGGDIVGDHTVLFAGTGERIEISHKSGSRVSYAQGSLRAARFLHGRTSGLFDMADVLQLA